MINNNDIFTISSVCYSNNVEVLVQLAQYVGCYDKYQLNYAINNINAKTKPETILNMYVKLLDSTFSFWYELGGHYNRTIKQVILVKWKIKEDYIREYKAIMVEYHKEHKKLQRKYTIINLDKKFPVVISSLIQMYLYGSRYLSSKRYDMHRNNTQLYKQIKYRENRVIYRRNDRKDAKMNDIKYTNYESD